MKYGRTALGCIVPSCPIPVRLHRSTVQCTPYHLADRPRWHPCYRNRAFQLTQVRFPCGNYDARLFLCQWDYVEVCAVVSSNKSLSCLSMRPSLLPFAYDSTESVARDDDAGVHVIARHRADGVLRKPLRDGAAFVSEAVRGNHRIRHYVTGNGANEVLRWLVVLERACRCRCRWC